jgi:hypothetical protein
LRVGGESCAVRKPSEVDHAHFKAYSDIAIAAATALSALGAAAQNTANLDVLRGLAPVTVLDQTNAGRAALAGNYARTGAIQHGAADQPILLPFAMQQQQALRDAFITDPNGSVFGVGLATLLGRLILGALRFDHVRASSLNFAGV